MTESPNSSSDGEPGNLPKVSKEEVVELLQHISMRMQLHRITKPKILRTLFGKDYDKERTITIQELRELLKKKPFQFSSEETTLLARYLLETEDGQIFISE
jgi:hypothetical protein